jgi:hypothetical protein
MSDLKTRIARAISRYETAQDKKLRGTTRRNGKPEKEVEYTCVAWMKSQGWSVNVFEAKATYSPTAGIWKQQAMSGGVADCMGNTQDGIAVAIEFKAPGYLSTFNSPARVKQRAFVIDKINSGAFACVTDSVERLKDIYTRWRELRDAGALLVSREFLIGALPKKRKD